MSIKHSLLALLAGGPRYGNELRTSFEMQTGSIWPLNVGQVYTTLDRLERDSLVAKDGTDDEGHVQYALTQQGRVELSTWMRSPVERIPPPRDELAIKLALAAELPHVDLVTLVQVQRSATLSTLQQLTRRKAEVLGDPERHGALITLDALLATVDADARLLDTVEARLRARTPETGHR